MANENSKKQFAELGSEAVKEGELYLVTPKGAVTSTGSQWLGAFKKGTENKLVIYFYGGGVSVDGYTAARGFSRHDDEFFYFDDMTLWKETAYGCFKGAFGSDLECNPFKEWSSVLLPYTTGDFHIGTGEFEYTDPEGKPATLYHYGYTNFKLYMERVMPYLGNPDTIVVSGSSAGGFGTAFLTEDITEMFPETKNVVSCVDASQLYWDKFPEVCRSVWKAPEHIANRFVSDNPVLDCLTTLHKDKPYVKILFTCSVRDFALVGFNNYFEKGAKTPGTREEGEIFQQRLFNFVRNLITVDNNAGVFIWSDMISDEDTLLTVHTIETGENFQTDRGGNGSIAKWISDAVNGNVRMVGLESFLNYKPIEKYKVKKSYDFEHHVCDYGLMEYLKTRTEYPYIKDGWLYYSKAFPIPIDSPMIYHHPAATAETRVRDYLTDLENIRIADLDYADITTAVLSADPVIYLLDKEPLIKYAKITNDTIAAAVKRHPDKYVGTICLPLPYVEESLAELDRAVNVLGLKIMNTWSNFKNRHIYDEEFEPVLAKCAELNVPIYMHPGIPGDEYLTDSGPSMASAGFGFSVDTMKTTMRLILSGIFDRYPNLSIIMGHMAEFFPYCLERIDNRFSEGAGAGCDPFVKCKKSFTEYFKNKNIMMSTSGISEPEVINFVINTIGPDSIVFGTDYPYEDHKAAADFIKNLKVSKEIKDKIFFKNAEKYILKA